MSDSLPPLDFGEIHGYRPPECCQATEEEVDISPVWRNFVLIAYKEPTDACGRHPPFSVNLHQDGSWSFTFLNGVSLTDTQKQTYCVEITGAQSRLQTWREWELRGKGLGVWDFSRNRMAGDDAAIEDNNTRYFPLGATGSSQDPQSCQIQGTVDFSDIRPA